MPWLEGGLGRRSVWGEPARGSVHDSRSEEGTAQRETQYSTKGRKDRYFISAAPATSGWVASRVRELTPSFRNTFAR